MKRFFLLFIAVMCSLSLSAQSIVLVDYENQNPLQNGDIITVQADPGEISLTGHLGVKNNSSEPIEISVRRMNMSVVAHSTNYFCWGACYDATVNLSPYPVTVAAGAINLDEFGSYYSHENPELPIPHGTTTICFSFMDLRNANDSAWVYIKFVIGNESVQEENAVSGKIYPNPANNFIFIESNATQNSDIEIYNITGQLVKTVPVLSEKTRIDVTDLRNGIYFYSIVTNGKKVDTKRFIISR